MDKDIDQLVEAQLLNQETPLTAIYAERHRAALAAESSTGAWFTDLRTVELKLAATAKKLRSGRVLLRQLLRDVESAAAQILALNTRIKRASPQEESPLPLTVTVPESEITAFLKTAALEKPSEILIASLDDNLIGIKRLRLRHQKAALEDQIWLKKAEADDVCIQLRDGLMELQALNECKQTLLADHPEILKIGYEERQIELAEQDLWTNMARRWAIGMVAACQGVARADAELIIDLNPFQQAIVMSKGQERFYQTMGKDALPSIIAELARLGLDDQESLLTEAGRLLEEAKHRKEI